MNSLKLEEIPTSPGIYKFFSKNKIIYIGKAKNLKKRVSSYFGQSFKDRKTNQIRILTDRIETFTTVTEVEALLLEQSLIKENLPRFNILLRDDKTYPYIYFSMEHKFPSISLKRTKRNITKNFFGPFISAQAARSTIKDLQKVYQIRNCTDGTFNNRSRPCIEHQMKRCSAPCVGLIGQENYKADIDSSHQYLSSSGKQTRSIMFDQMKKFSDAQDFEQANEIKKRIRSLDLLNQEPSSNIKPTSIDLFSCISKFDRTGICILSVRDGKIRGTKTYCLNGNLLSEIDDLFQSLIFSYYQNTFALPNKIVLTTKVDNIGLIKDAIKLKFQKKILITHNVNSKIRNIAKLGILNANQIIDNKIDHIDKYTYAFKDLVSYIGIKYKKSISIEGYDISHHSGKFAVASAVRFSKNGPDKSGYRVFNIPEELSGNDIGSIKNVLKRRLNKSLVNPLPDIILVDGGINQLNAALKIFNKEYSNDPVILSIVKGSKRVRLTETILSKNGVVEMPKNSPGFILLQQIRDESHRFAIKNNRVKKTKSIRFSELHTLRGVGPVLRERLFKQFKTLKSLKKSTIYELSQIKGINNNLASKILDHLNNRI